MIIKKELVQKMKAHLSGTGFSDRFFLMLFSLNGDKKILLGKRALIAETLAKEVGIDSGVAFLGSFLSNITGKDKCITIKEKTSYIDYLFRKFGDGLIFRAYCTELQYTLEKKKATLTVEDFLPHSDSQIAEEILEIVKKAVMIIVISNEIGTFLKNIKKTESLTGRFPDNFNLIIIAFQESVRISNQKIFEKVV